MYDLPRYKPRDPSGGNTHIVEKILNVYLEGLPPDEKNYMEYALGKGMKGLSQKEIAELLCTNDAVCCMIERRAIELIERAFTFYWKHHVPQKPIRSSGEAHKRIKAGNLL